MYIRRSEDVQDVLCTFNLCPVSTGLGNPITIAECQYRDNFIKNLIIIISAPVLSSQGWKSLLKLMAYFLYISFFKMICYNTFTLTWSLFSSFAKFHNWMKNHLFTNFCGEEKLQNSALLTKTNLQLYWGFFNDSICVAKYRDGLYSMPV